MTANSVWAWFKKWGLWILLGFGGLLFIITRLLPSDGRKPELLQKAKDQAEALKNKAKEELARHDAIMAERRKELEDIKAIENEDERLERLAEFANRR